MNYRIVIVLSLAVLVCFKCSKPSAINTPFAVQESQQGVALLENSNLVFFYQSKPKQSAGKYVFNNYLHPLYDLNGDTLTDEFPEDHPHHRGIFWAWHQLFINNKRIGDSWTMENISQEVVSVKVKLNKTEAQLKMFVLWKSSAIQNEKPFIEENTTITVHRHQSDIRKIDFEIALKPLVSRVEMGGSEEVEKGYGGFSVRIKLPKSLVFTSSKGPVTPLEGQVRAGAWMDFSAYYDSTHQGESGMAILCHPTTPNYPAPWILRQTGSMQNIVFPGAKRIELSMEKPTILRYRLIIHRGNATRVDIASLQSEYEKMYTSN